jgi:hypothetical protein
MYIMPRLAPDVSRGEAFRNRLLSAARPVFRRVRSTGDVEGT